MESKHRQRRISISTRDTRDREVMTGSKEGPFWGLLAREGGDPPKIPDRRQAGWTPEPAASRAGEALLHVCRGACPGLPELGPYRPPPVNSVGGERRRSGRAGWWTCRGFGSIIHAKSHLRKHSGPFSRPVIILPKPGAVVRFATCNICDERGDRRQQGGHVWRPLAHEGGDPPKIPRSR